MSAKPRGASRGAGVTLQAAADACLSSPRCAHASTRRAYAGVIDKLAGDEIAVVLVTLWATVGESTWHRTALR